MNNVYIQLFYLYNKHNIVISGISIKLALSIE